MIYEHTAKQTDSHQECEGNQQVNRGGAESGPARFGARIFARTTSFSPKPCSEERRTGLDRHKRSQGSCTKKRVSQLLTLLGKRWCTVTRPGDETLKHGLKIFGKNVQFFYHCHPSFIIVTLHRRTWFLFKSRTSTEKVWNDFGKLAFKTYRVATFS